MVQNKTAWKHGAARAVKAIFAVLGALTIVFFACRQVVFNHSILKLSSRKPSLLFSPSARMTAQP